MSLEIKIKYFSDEITKITKIKQGDWIDLRAASTVAIPKNEFQLIPLGVAMQLPSGYEAHIAPRSGTYKNFRIIQTNSVGVVDESYCGPNDQWLMPVYAMEDTVIELNDRVCQFRIVEKMPEVVFVEVEELDNPDRNGFGSTGKK